MLIQKRVCSAGDVSPRYLRNVSVTDYLVSVVSVVPVVSQNACGYGGSRHGPVRTALGSRRNGQAAYTAYRSDFETVIHGNMAFHVADAFANPSERCLQFLHNRCCDVKYCCVLVSLSHCMYILTAMRALSHCRLCVVVSQLIENFL